MKIVRQKTFARSLFTRGTFGNRMRSLYHNTGEALNRRMTRSAAVTAAYPDKVVAEGFSNFGLPAIGSSVGGPVGTAIAVAPVGHGYVLGAQKLNGIKVGKDGKTLGDVRKGVAKKTMVSTKQFLDKHGVNKEMKNLDQTRIGHGLAKVYKGGSKVFEGARTKVLDAKNSFSSSLASSGNLAPRPAVRF